VITSRPARQYQAIGVIELEAASVKTLPNDEASFRRAIASEVCRVGGDAVIPGVNGDSRYVLATVVRWVEDDRKTPICPKPPKKRPDAGAPDGGQHDAGKRVPDAGAPATQSMDAGADASADASPARLRSARAMQGGAPC
jgi:hypothetical protein